MYKVFKFGGSSVANASAITQAMRIVQDHASNSHCIVVVSALSGTTDALISIANQAALGNDAYNTELQQLNAKHITCVTELLPVTNQSATISWVQQQFNTLAAIAHSVYTIRELSLQCKDHIIGYGEMLSSYIITAYCNSIAMPSTWVNAKQLITTNATYGNAAVHYELTNQAIQAYYAQHNYNVYIVPGFVAATSTGTSTTLGRGGSDYTAAIIGAALHVQEVLIYTDVSGMMTADPRIVPNAKPITTISYQEAMELSHFGAKVLYPPTIQPLLKKGIPIHIKNTFDPTHPGTIIQATSTPTHTLINGITSINHIALLNLEGSGMIGITGTSHRLFQALAQHHINVILITQSSSENSICVGILQAHSTQAVAAINTTFEYEIYQKLINPVVLETDLSIIALVGEGMKNHTGISGKAFNALGKNGINIRAIAQGSSEKNISIVVQSNEVKKAVNTLHESFFENASKQINLYLLGVGNVGTKLIAQLMQQQPYLLSTANVQLNVVGIANSKQYVLNPDGIPLHTWQQALAQGEVANMQAMTTSIQAYNLRNAIVVDTTASHIVPEYYSTYLHKSISVVACNKIAASSAYHNYSKLKLAAVAHNCKYLFETNVGAGLPIIATIKDLLQSGDTVHAISAVLSGTLNYVFNNYNGTIPFAQVVQQAQDQGYTEPDPRLDLGGTDVMRKILILAREAGAVLEMEDITNTPFMPAACMQAATISDFYTAMLAHEPHYVHMYQAAKAENCILKYVANYSISNGVITATVGLQHIPPSHNLYHLYGKDNIVLFTTDRYQDQPLVIKGAGAGADVTASGVFADIMRISS